MALDRDPHSMSTQSLSKAASDPTHPMHMHAKIELKRRKGDMKESKDEFEPHMMYDPKTGKGYMAKKPADHDRMKKMGYGHDKPKTEGAMKRIATTQSNKADRMASGGKKGLETFKKKVNEVSAKTLSNYMRKSTADAGNASVFDVRRQDKRIGGQKRADDKLRKMDGKGSAAKVAATKEANTYVGQRDQMKITDRKPHPDGGHIVTLQTKAGKTIKRHLKNGKVKDIKEAQLDELTAAEKKLVNQMYDKKGNLTPMGKKVMNHGKKPGDKGYVESVNELSKDTMQSYWDKTKGDDAFSGSRKANNRLKGAINVTTKLDRIKKMVKKK